jgi:hypothetical protein
MADISDLPAPKKSEIGDLPAPPAPVSAAKAFGKSALESAGGAAGGYAGAELGAMAGAPLGPVGIVGGGLAGGIAGYYGGEKLQEKLGQAIPSSVKETLGFSPEQRAAEKAAAPTASKLGSVAPDVAAAAPLIYGMGRYGIAKGTDFLKSVKKPEPVANVEDLSKVGEKGYDLLQKNADKLYQARRVEAESKYKDAFDAARQAQAKGQPFATSPQGQQLLQQLEREKTIIAGGKKFGVGEEQVAGIDRLINAIKGKTVGGQSVPVGKGAVSSKVTKKTPSETTEKDIKALVEELRFLRDVDAKGKPYEAYAGLSAEYKRDLKAGLEKALHEWSPEYRAADEAYKAASSKLAPFQTELMSKALKSEKFNPKDLVASPEEFGKTFFKDVDGVRQLKEVTQDPAQVATLGKEYVASILANKTPQEVKAWATNTANTGWLKEAGINDAVQKYAQQAATAENRQKILARLGYAATAGALGTAIGAPMYYGTKRALGI